MSEIADTERNIFDMKPKIVLKYPDSTLIYVYVDKQLNAWVEYNSTDQNAYVDKIMKQDWSSFMVEDSEIDCDLKIYSILNQSQFMIKNLDYIIDPDVAILNFKWHQFWLKVMNIFNICLEFAMIAIIIFAPSF